MPDVNDAPSFDRERDTSFSLSPEQRALMRTGSGTHAIERILRIDIDGPIDEALLRAAVGRVCNAHEVLRHEVRAVTGYRTPRQVIRAEPLRIDWQVVDLVSSSAPQQSAAWASWASDSMQPADFGRVRATLLRTSPSLAFLGLAFHGWLVDAGSLAVIVKQLAAASRGKTDAAVDPFPYRQFVAWREDLAETDDTDEADVAVAHWAALQRNAEGVHAPRLAMARSAPLPTSAPRRQIARTLDQRLVERTLDVATMLRTTARTVLQATWWILVLRLNSGAPALVGWQHDCRDDYDPMRGAVGVYEKILPWLIDAPADISAEQWLVRFTEHARTHLDAQEFWAADAPPFDSHLRVGYAELHVAGPQVVGAATWHWRHRPAPSECFDLALQLEWGDTETGLSWHANASLYDEAALQCVAEQYLTLLDGVLSEPARSIQTLPLLGDRERAAQASWGAPMMQVGSAMLGWHIARWSVLSPQEIAIESRSDALDYRALEARVRRVAASLRAKGVRTGDLVALILPRSADLLVALLAAWRLGAGYLPLDPEWPPARRQAVLDDAQPRLSLDAGAFAALPDAGDGQDLPAPRGSRSDSAYVLYTSGSTGRPKGVVIEQGALLNYVTAASDAMSLSRCRRWGLTSAVAADLGNTALFGALFNGAALVVAEDDEVRQPEAFARFIRDFGIDALKIVPSHLEALLDAQAPALPATIVLGGEAAPRPLVKRIAAIEPACRIFNHYGPTETTVGVLIHAVSPHDDADALPLTRVLANNRVRVLDAQRQPVASGQQGEVFVGGAQLCRGYLNRDGEALFVDDPMLPGEKLYRTGDLAVLLPSGGLQLAGRADHQVKIRGHRVEPAEVESALLAQPGVRQAVVLTPTSAGGGIELVAVLVMDAVAHDADMLARLRAGMSQALPAHMRPARYAVVDEFPRLGNGKVDRLALSTVHVTDRPPEIAARAPRDALEAWLADSMATLLGRATVGADDDFFELGGHSLLAIKLVARLRKRLALELAPALVFDHPSAAALGIALREMGVDEGLLAAPLETAEIHGAVTVLQ